MSTAPVIDMNRLRIEPCILVTDRLTVERAVKYDRDDLNVQVNPDGSEDATWKTKRHYMSKEETAEANAVYARARNRIRSVCAHTEIGFIAPVSKQPEIEQAVIEAKQIVEEANSRFNHCRVHFRVVCTRLDPNNEDGVAILADEFRGRTAEIRAALANFDVRKVREVLTASKNMANLLADPDMRKELIASQAEARELAHDIVKLVKAFDGSVENAMCSVKGVAILNRANAVWNF